MKCFRDAIARPDNLRLSDPDDRMGSFSCILSSSKSGHPHCTRQGKVVASKKHDLLLHNTP